MSERDISRVLTGQVVSADTLVPVPRVRVELWDSTAAFHEIIAVARTDNDGDFAVTLTDAEIERLFGQRRVTLAFRVFDGQRLLVDTADTLTWNLGRDSTQVRIVVDSRPPAPTNITPASYVVRGRVIDSQRGPLAGVSVKAFDKLLRSEVELAQGVTDARGYYRLSYPSLPLEQRGKLLADLVIRAFDNNRRALTEKEVCHAPPNAMIDLLIGEKSWQGPPEFDRIQTALSDVHRQVRAEEWTVSDTDRIACGTQLPLHAVRRFAVAHRLEAEFGIASPVAYAVLTQGLPWNRSALAKAKAPRLREAIQRAVEVGAIGPIPAEDVEQALGKFRAAAVRVAFEASEGQTSLGDLLRLTLSQKQAEQFLGRNFDHDGAVSDFWKALAAQNDFAEPVLVEQVRFVLQLGMLTSNNLLLVKNLRAKGFKAPRELAKLDDEDWLQFVEDSGVPAAFPETPPEDRTRIYARSLAVAVERSFPTPVLTERMRKLRITADASALLFLDQHPDFEFGSGKLRSWMKRHPEALSSIPDAETVLDRLHCVQRLFRVSAGPDRAKTTLVLREHQFNSALSIARLGQREFVRRMAPKLVGGEARAREVFRLADHTRSRVYLLKSAYAGAFDTTQQETH